MSVSPIDLAPWGYAMGDTIVFCVDCPTGRGFRAHRHSIRCREHALGARLDDIRAAEGQGKEDTFGRNPIEAAIRIHQSKMLACRDIFIVGVGLAALFVIYWIATAT